jgi:hypothetical protein
VETGLCSRDVVDAAGDGYPTEYVDTTACGGDDCDDSDDSV